MIPRISSEKRLILLFSFIALLTGQFIYAEVRGVCPDESPAGAIVVTADNGCYTGTDPGHGIRPGERTGGKKNAPAPESLSGSYVSFDPANGDDCWFPGTVHNFAFTTVSSTTDWEYVYNLWLRFPADWTVTNVAVVGTPACSSGGSFGTMSWSSVSSNEINIIHSRYQATTDTCTVTYLVTVTTGAAGPDAPVSWFWDGDGYGSAPHNPCSSDNYTPSGQSACDQATNPPATVPACSLSGIYLSVNPSSQEACPGEGVTYPVTVQNYTGAAATFNISVSGNSWAVSAPATVGPVADSGTSTFNITHTIDPAAADGAADTPMITAVDQANAATSDSATFTTSAGIEFWHTIPSSSPSWLGAGYPCRGCTARNASGQWNTYIIGDTSGSGPVGFWAYNHSTNVWSQPGPSGLPADRWSPGWAYDPDTNLCYMTGGANTPGGGTYNTAYAYDPVANAFTALPSFTTIRDFHNSWVGTIDGTKYLIVGGGVSGASTYLSSTQCLNLSTSTWQAENTVMPAYSFGARWGAAEGLTGSRFWVASGADGSGNLVTSAYYFDDSDNAWHAGGDVPTPVYRTNGAVSGGDFYVIGGSIGGFSPSDAVQRYSGGTWETLDPMPHSRMDLVCGVGADENIWVVDGYTTAAGSDYVDYLEFCEGTGGCPTITLSPATLPEPTVGLAYSQTIAASGGTAPYTYEVTSGVLPAGLTLDPATGVISGTPTSAGSYTFTITATDAAACTGTITYTMNMGYGWNLSVVDDAGRASACLNTDTGYYAWTVLTGFGAGTYVGRSNVTFAYNTYYFQSPIPSGMNLKVSMTTNKASGSYMSPPLRERSICIDANITDNPACP
ncbi:MAG TPA: putative Ig domain-containing protein [Acidobacteriota bacterium]|nr:putative Ig domain-containing protein [Acidobacteriota bacterium]HNT17030.1 putative Ig domain-containing protein [Acidobacteriota bacterium]HPA26398.1 putative Ig domain-containing protein [Acidobacteriota bacterium]HQO19304.1 putative Ig domain-containing protein [Acidobacteriota bacterium]HQQ46515.1 putative Ig domain-containing protein [Acidobacteriota bacterium]